MNTLENLLQQWTSDELTCRNGIVVEYSMALTGCLMANTAVHAVGVGQASKNAGVYLVKYLSKDSVQIAISADAIVDAHTRAEQHPSTAEDSGTATWKAQQHMQIIHNHNVIELDGVQVAAMVLGIKSSGGSENMSYYSGSDARRVASELVSENLAGDDENMGEGEERQNRDITATRKAIATLPTNRRRYRLMMAMTISTCRQAMPGITPVPITLPSTTWRVELCQCRLTLTICTGIKVKSLQ